MTYIVRHIEGHQGWRARSTFSSRTLLPQLNGSGSPSLLRALPVLAAVTPEGEFVERLKVVDQAIEEFPFGDVRQGDLVGISIHTFNAIHGYTLAREARTRGASVVFGGPHASIFPEEALRYGDAVVTGDGEIAWRDLLADHAGGRLRQTYGGGRIPGESCVPARWDVMPLDRYLVASIQTVRGCPKSCSFCSVWVQDGRVPRVRATDAVLQEVQYLYRAGFRLVMFADDNFYPYTLEDIAQTRSPELSQRASRGREARLELLNRLATEVPRDMHFCTQITMEVADDPEFLFWTTRPEIGRVWLSIYTPQKSERSAETLTPESRQRLIEELPALKRKYPALFLPHDAVEAFRHPPADPSQCTFARVSVNYSANLRARIEPCFFGGNHDCSQLRLRGERRLALDEWPTSGPRRAGRPPGRALARGRPPRSAPGAPTSKLEGKRQKAKGKRQKAKGKR